MNASLLNYAYLLLVLAAGFLVSACDNDTPTVYGNDGASLTNVDLTNAVALMAAVDDGSTFNFRGHPFKRQTLYTIDAGGGLTPALFTVTGNQNGGFDWYSVNDLDRDYFLISFYRRKETYVVRKADGVATKTAFMEIDDLTTGESKSFGLSQQGTLYFRDIHGNHNRVDNVLSTNAVLTPEPGLTGNPDQWYFDKQGKLYVAEQDKLFYSNNGVATPIASASPVNLWNDLDGVLRMIDSNGKIFVVINGNLVSDGETGIPLTSAKFRTFAFPQLQKQMAVFTSFTGPTLLYDLKARKTLSTIEPGNEYFDIAGADSYGDFIVLAYIRGTELELLKIDVSGEEPSTLTIQLNKLEPVTPGGVFAISNEMTLFEIEAPNSQIPYFNYENSDGLLKQLHTTKVYGNVIELTGL